MRILHINKFFDHHDGVDIYLERLIQHQTSAGHDVHVLATRSADNIASSDQASFIHRFDFSKSEGVKKDAQKALAFLWNREARDTVARTIASLKPDVVHLHNIYHHLSSSILAPIRTSGVRCVQTLHDLKLGCPNYSMFTQGAVCERCKGGKYWNAITHRCLFPWTIANVLGAVEMTATKIASSYERTVHRFITPSQFYRDKLIEWGEPASKFSVILNPADCSASSASLDGNYLLYAGRLEDGKGVECLIRAAATVPHLPIKIAGAGPEAERLRHLARSLGASHISFLGFVRGEELSSIRRRAQAVLVPSIWYENGPLTVLEAMSDGVPVIGSDIGGIPELVEHAKEGWLVAPNDVGAWARALESWCHVSHSDRLAMGVAGRARILSRHGWSGHLAALEREYRAFKIT